MQTLFTDPNCGYCVMVNLKGIVFIIFFCINNTIATKPYSDNCIKQLHDGL